MTKQKKHIDFHLIGISNHPTPQISDEVKTIITKNQTFSGGKRHYQLIKNLLPTNHQWIEISGDIPNLIQQYQTINQTIVIFVSGDPFFYGFGNTLMRLLPDSQIQSHPFFNSIQLLCHRTQTNYNELKSVSIHGRNWNTLDQALIKDEPLIGILTDEKKNPATIAARLLQYNFDHYTMIIGENLDSPDEKIITQTLEEISKQPFAPLNCVLLKRQHPQPKPFGLKDTDFVHLPNRPNMITKMMIRLNTLQASQLENTKTLWDIGTCTGSVAIEAKRHYPHLEIVAIEKREVCKEIIQSNTEKFSTPGIQIIIDDFFQLDHTQLPKPDTIFIGGHGNQLPEMIQTIHQLAPHATIVTNAVQETTTTTFTKELKTLNYQLITTTITIDHHNQIKILTAKKMKNETNVEH